VARGEAPLPVATWQMFTDEVFFARWPPAAGPLETTAFKGDQSL